jgi:hypothetical protein
MKTEKEKCKSFQNCSASLCPLDPNKNHYWYSDSEICRKGGTEWIKVQRKIQKTNPDPHKSYTIKELISQI